MYSSIQPLARLQGKSTHSPAWVILHSGAPAEQWSAVSSLAHPRDAACGQSQKPVAASSPAERLQCPTCVAANQSTTRQGKLLIREFLIWYVCRHLLSFLQRCWPRAAESPACAGSAGSWGRCCPAGACWCSACAAPPFQCCSPSASGGHRSASPGQLSSISEPLCLHAGFAAASGLLPASQDARRGKINLNEQK